jgi:hypothetical protein
MDPERPFYFLLDMGNWKIFNSVESVEVETTKEHVDYYRGGKDAPRHTKEGTYNSMNMVMSDLQILYNFEGHNYFFNKALQDKNFKICEKLKFGFQYQSLIRGKASSGINCPPSLMNLKFQEFHLNYERSVFREFLKLKTFASSGSYQKHLKLMSKEDDFGAGESAVKENSSSELLVEKLPANQDNSDEFRINLIFYKIEIRKQSVDWSLDKIVQTSKLRIAADTQQISLSMKQD